MAKEAKAQVYCKLCGRDLGKRYVRTKRGEVTTKVTCGNCVARMTQEA